MSWFNTVEFYVIAGTVAAAAVALAAVPSRREEAITHLLSGSLAYGAPAPALDVWVDDSRHLHLRRSGFDTMGDRGAVSLAVNVVGTDITIDERLVFDRRGDQAVNSAEFVLDFLRRDRYHICYRGDDTGVFAAFSLPMRPGIRLHRDLSV